METRTEWEEVVSCEHSYDKRCQRSLVTVYTSVQEEECREEFVKNCWIEYTQMAVNVTVQLCR